MPHNTLKENTFQFCKDFIDNRLNRLHKQIQEIQTALSSETKSSAGDKHETGRAMVQLEREKLGAQLAEAEKVAQLLSKIDIEKSQEKIGLGSLVKTNKLSYFIAISAGEYKGKDVSVYCISAATPIAKLLLGKSVNEAIVFNGIETIIKDII
ncbi:3-oxoacyl-ACP synthase [uncultured Maribacter sp.]|uniref:3-oxoacyl-ACP synthase n=1 Tax=uncultured Maribacter sp. TaxID=431308 RepID=UPI00261D6876|nr:3-oxoacyl-ACP synthase [uncultured Maribacter sp.]